jgi:proteasome lid subunit RPN8/RPN11
MLSGSRTVPVQFHLSDAILAEVERIGRERMPSEACGLILPPPGDRAKAMGSHPQVIELPNRSLTPQDSYEMSPGDAQIELERWMARDSVTQEHIDMMVCWHTHPGGGVGPSKNDLENRPPDISMIVVTLIGDKGHIYTIF